MLSIPAYTALIVSDLQSKSYMGHFFNGSMLPVFAMAVATGVVNTSITLTGAISGGTNIGTSSGVGIMFSGSNVSQGIRTAAVALFGGEGAALKDFCDALGDATQTHFLAATLASDTNGTAHFPSFSGAISSMTAAIIAAAPSFNGSQWPNFAKAIATGICQEIGSNGTGTLSGATGTGTGSGVVTIS